MRSLYVVPCLILPHQKDKNLPPMTPLIRVLLGMSLPSKKIPITDLKFFDETLNPSQQEAIKFAVESPEIACIHGPPGLHWALDVAYIN